MLNAFMDYQHISFSFEERVARIKFVRPPLNVFNIAMMREIGDAIERAGSERELVAIVFEAAEGSRAFSAGVAVGEHAAETIYQMLEAFHDIFRALEALAKPTLAVVDGAALGGGCELVAACDIVVASERARFGQPEIKLGVFPPIAVILLPRVIGEKRARELILTGELIDAQEAVHLGLVNYGVNSAQLEQKTQEILDRLRDLSTSALEMTRRALDMGRGWSFDELLSRIEHIYLDDLMKTEDASEGVRAFMEKRKPVWRNR
ncbi:MAG: cyclohexa,5-dienecarbonyl-CoA hydratase [Acidobacteriota bacterium]|nr:cyclohexa,5-dienecarbonyl-CoA hydratase [Acidobacteriota bacterium]